MKLADIRPLRVGGFGENDATNATRDVLDEAMMRTVANQIGKTFSFRVVGPQPQMAAQMGVFGTDVYTLDSSLAASALHAGVVRPGEAAIIRVTFVGQHAGFVASLRNGVMSYNYSSWPDFRIEQPKGGDARRRAAACERHAGGFQRHRSK